MKYFPVISAFALTALMSVPAYAEKVDCNTLKQSIEEKMTSHGAKNFKLDVVDAAQAGDGKVVGSCDGGTHKIVYTKDAAVAASK